jgi:maltose alpha-D-glucosyltransferase/alpha-amylase
VPAFAPEPFTEFYRHSVYHGILAQLNRSLDALRSRTTKQPDTVGEEVRRVLEREADIRNQLLLLRDRRILGLRTRLHGDYQLNNLLHSGHHWLVVNFEGDPYRSLSERRIKRSPIRDIATMLRSFHYVSHAALFGDVPGIIPSREGHPTLERWAQLWYRWVSCIFLKEYLRSMEGTGLLPQSRDQLRVLLGSYLLERALLEIEYEFQHRPQWIRIPLHGILEHLAEK